MRVFTVMEGSSSPTRVGIFLGMCGLQEPPPEYPAQTGIDLRNWTSSDIIERLTPHARGSTRGSTEKLPIFLRRELEKIAHARYMHALPVGLGKPASEPAN